MFDVFVFLLKCVCASSRWFVCYIHNTRCKVWKKMEPQKLKELWTNGANLVPWERNSHVFVSITERCKTKVPLPGFRNVHWFISEKDGILMSGYGGCWGGTTHYSGSCWYTCVNFVGFGGHLIWKKRKDIKLFRKIEDPKRLQLCFNV